MKNIVLFASGGGSNAEQIMSYFSQKNTAKVVLVLTNNANAGVLDKAKAHNVPIFVFTKEELNNGFVLRHLQAFNPHLIVLAGFLLKFPADIIEAYPHSVINIHPALLPKYGGKGMYGLHVHRAVLENKEKESGITIHYVDDNYDEGNIIFQQAVAVEECITPEEVALKVLALEHEHFPAVIEQLILNN
ncbi:phosphoribosylglycinamide formyltransferase [Flavobacterium akiainvivens]|uniref:Phosphoribosylglycinamide formyltransferase n=1 Tax=Flavobacterium akiainvivens TaxID=1202724 RepID=A0A0M8MDV0_9FLAO|nr:phosphoribosylglycinamide formyltransferase [Flavobacterium akiainvivens]KOS06794.1 phosphoribosylglycinamide formyltransferase [Flavobacterium akiainvivens]SFQ78004.1 formyltetrahydrofolate-dependent phosphoribosylglycinamide formyltransferase [Flavobacterium akiainvivens]